MNMNMLEGMDTKDIILKHVAPGLGCVIAFFMFFSPFKAVMQVRASRHLGDLNPLPLVAIIANCAGWLLYGCINRDKYVILANEPGLMLGIFMTVSCYGFADAKTRDNMLRGMLFFGAIISGVGIATSLFIKEHDVQSTVAGYTAVFILLCYYTAPLSTMAEVLRTRSSVSLYLPTSAMNTVNGSLWVAYAVAVHDDFIFYPNLFGAITGLIQIALIFIYPAGKRSSRGASGEQERLVDDDETERA